MAKKARSKRNIEEVGSPEKTGKELGASPIKSPNSKKAREEGEGIDKKDEVTHTSPFKVMKDIIVSLVYGSAEKGKDKRQEEIEEDQKEKDKQAESEQKEERQKEKVKEIDEKGEGEAGGKKDTQKEPSSEREAQKELSSEKEKEIEKEKPKTLDQKVITGDSPIEYNGIKISREDLKSLEGKNWITSTALEGFRAWMEETMSEEIKTNRILLIPPHIAQIFQYGDRESAHQHREIFKTKDFDYIFYPISNTSYPKTGKLDGGLHWSLMIFSKKEHAFRHYDSIRGMNGWGAKQMVVNMGNESDFNDEGQWPAFYEADCSRQDNSWACGSYLMYFAHRAIK